MWRPSTRTVLIFLVLLGLPTPASALEISSGISLGGILAGRAPRLAVTPQGGIAWTTTSGFLFAVHEMISILPPLNNTGFGVYEQTAVVVGYAAETRNFSIGPSLSIYSMPACGATLCGRVVGLAPGGHAQVNVYLYERLGVSVSTTLDWVGGRSLVLPGGLAVMVVAGPVLRWIPE
jgi:hypothetical protein